MNSWSPRQLRLIAWLLLGLIMVLAFFMTSIPHWHYLYPLHIDDWMHYGQAQSLIEAGRVSYPNPFEAGEVFAPDPEAGFHLWLGELWLITGISWMGMFRFLPGIIFALLAFAAYAFYHGGGRGLGAAFLVTLIPTTIRFLGPAFLVPVALGLIFIPMVLLILGNLLSTIRGPVLLLCLLLALLFIHPPTFTVTTGIVAVYLVLFRLDGNVPQGWRLPAIVFACLASMYVFMLFRAPSYFSFVINEALDQTRHLPLPPIQSALPKFGYIPAALFTLGVGILAYRGKRANWTLVLSAVGLLAYELIYPYFYIGPDIVYERGWLYIFVLMALVGAGALTSIYGWLRKALSKKPTLAAATGYAVIGVILVASLGLSLQGHMAEPYYHVVDDATCQDFRWVREYVPASYQVGVLDTAQAWAFAAISGKSAYTAEVSPNFHAKGSAAKEFLGDGAGDISWLIQGGINIVYTGDPVENKDLIKVSHNLYLLTEELEDT